MICIRARGGLRDGVVWIMLTTQLVAAAFSSRSFAGESFPHGVDWQTKLQELFGTSTDVEEGHVFFFLESDCPPLIEKFGSCFGNNPASPYGMYVLGDYEGEADRFRYRIAEHQAVIFIGLTPPEARYYSFQTYPFSRHYSHLRGDPSPGDVWFCDEPMGPAGCPEPRKTLVGMVGPNLNHLELVTDGGDEDSFGKATVVVTTANRVVEALIRARLPNLLAELGIASNAINVERIPCASATPEGFCDDDDPRNLVLGSEPDADDFIIAIRLAMIKSRAALQAYMDTPPATVLRLSFTDLIGTFEPYPWAPEPVLPPAERFNEDPYKDALRWLAERVREVYAPGGTIRAFNTGGSSYYKCIEEEKSCNAGSEDAYYSKGPDLPNRCLTGDVSLFVVGVNHSQVGPYSYFSLSIRDPDERHEVGHMADIPYIVPNLPDEPPNPDAEIPPNLLGSVEFFLPRAKYPRPDALEGKLSKLYVAEITPNCDHPYCLAASADTLPGELLGFQERVYLNTITGSRPGPDNFIPSRVIVPAVGTCDPSIDPCSGDFGHDGIVDLGDYHDFAACMEGVDVTLPEWCEPADADGDNDADLEDFAALALAFTMCR